MSYLCNKQAKVVAMTCTHAALKRREFLNLGLKYDNIVMEEAGQVSRCNQRMRLSILLSWGSASVQLYCTRDVTNPISHVGLLMGCCMAPA